MFPKTALAIYNIGMNYLFFDTECANCLNGEGKICSFGFVLCDENFNILKKKDILIDPDAKFLLGNAKKGEGIKLAYPLFKFKDAHKYPYHHKEISTLLEKENTLAVGFSLRQDISFLGYTTKRYGFALPHFRFLDVQVLDKAITKSKDYRGLGTLISEFGLQEFTYHRSDDDALMTMEALSKILASQNLTVEQAVEKYPFSIGDSVECWKEIVDKRRQKEEKKKQREKMQTLYDNDIQPTIEFYTSFFWNKKIFVRSSALYRKSDFFLKNKDLLHRMGIIFTTDLSNADIVVFERGENIDSLKVINKKAIYLTSWHMMRKVESYFPLKQD